jgi:hypothetical protein
MGSRISAEQPGSYEIAPMLKRFGSWHETDLPGRPGAVWSAVWAGIAVILRGDLYLTPAGGRYLASETHKRMSNSDRKDVVTMMKEVIARFE